MIKDKDMIKYDIRDVWMALKLAVKNFLIVASIIPFITIMLTASVEDDKLTALMVFLSFTTALFIQSIIIYFANRRYVIYVSKGLVTFPRSDIENSILDILLLLPYWNLMRTITIKCTDIENIYIDTKRVNKKRKNVKYTINITGTFGSANLQFLDRQKRDEVRNAIQQCVKHKTGKNVDRKVAEFN